MAKKKNKKFKSQSKVESKPVSLAAKQSVSDADKSGLRASMNEERKNAEPELITKDELTLLNEKYSFVRKDVTKLLITLGVLAILFVGFYILGKTTGTLESVGSWIYKITNIQIL
jgi:uncharacterized membrane protein